MPTHIRIGIIEPSRRRDHDERGRDKDKQLSGWAKPREKLGDEPRMTNLNMSLGRWLVRASANSGPKIAPGIGTKKSS